jgi:DNA-binding response OmpR family regulator
MFATPAEAWISEFFSDPSGRILADAGRDPRGDKPELFPSPPGEEAERACAARIALVEDNPADVFLIQLAFMERNLRADWIVMDDGEAGFDFIEAIEEGRTAAPQVFILDLSLPRRNGPELLEKIRASRACCGARVVIASSSYNPEDQAIAKKSGADSYFVKPSNYDEFMKIADVVSNLLRPA